MPLLLLLYLPKSKASAQQRRQLQWGKEGRCWGEGGRSFFEGEKNKNITWAKKKWRDGERTKWKGKNKKRASRDVLYCSTIHPVTIN